MFALFRFCVALLVLHSLVPVSWGKLKIGIEHSSSVTAGSNGTVTWHRDSDDPTRFFLIKFLHQNNKLSPSQPFPVYVDKKETNGTVSLPFINKGKFHLAAFNTLKHNSQPIAHTDPFQVAAAKNHSMSGSDMMQPGQSSLPTPSSTVIQSQMSHKNASPHSLSTPLIVGVSIGCLLGAILILVFLYYFLRRRRRKLSSIEEYPFASPTPPSLQMSNSSPFWRRFWNDRKLGLEIGVSATPTTTINMANSSTTLGEGAADTWDSNRNFYKTPKPPKVLPNRNRNPFRFSTNQKSSSSKRGLGFDGSAVTGDTGTSLSSLRFSPNTERQMEIDDRIEELTGKLALLQRSIGSFGQSTRTKTNSLATMTHNLRILKWKNQIERLRELKDSDWAWGRTDVIPPGLYGLD